ncbi:DUF3221 domain-containing protein [Bacillus niameyensis]|uniref:DUF3221 domain-containing protein n=1 Tax=Bacillus niameyensis TaxID=1522308 RepID=UPI000781CFCA|nr:DUF3221 domain-containing protein [Bacillus niameyensis]
MPRIFKVLTIIALFTIAGCSNSIDQNEDENNDIKTENFSFIGTIKEISGNRAIVSATIFENNPEGDVFVDLSVNNKQSFKVGDKVKVGFDGTVRESNPAQINTLSVELVD